MEKMLAVTVYADTTGLFTEEQINWLLDGPSVWGNICDILVPESIVREWYEKYCADDDEADTFEKWFKEVYTCDDTDGLHEFAAERMGADPQLAESRYNDLLKLALKELEERKSYKDDEEENE